MKQTQQLLKKHNIPFNEVELKVVFNPKEKSDKNNSRYIFLGQFYLKGFLSHWIFYHVAGTGTELQHYLGNIFSPIRLSFYFDKWKLIEDCPEYENRKHLLVFAILGYIVTKTDANSLESFVKEEFIFPNDRFLPQNYKSKNQWNQLIYLAKLHFSAKPKLIANCDEKIHTISIEFQGEILGAHSSISYKYARKKAIKLALKKMVERIGADPLVDSTEMFDQDKERKEFLKQLKQEKHRQKILDHTERMAERRKRKKEEAKELDRKRKLNKQAVKEKSSKKGKNTIYREYTPEEIATMSSAKRRNLQDRGIIPKGI